MFEEKVVVGQYLTNLVILLKKLSISTWVYLVSLLTSCFFIILALLKLQTISNAVSVEIYSQASESKENSISKIYADVGGAVKHPGVYSLEYGQRLARAIEMAGGLSNKADKIFVSQTLNLAKLLDDGEKIYIPFEGELENQNSEIQNSELDHSNLVSINNGSLEELDSLPGIGEKRAEDILANRPYSKIKDLVEQNILSEGIFNGIEEYIGL
ncbi:MAG: SLBB domain-containing protein [Patescibacteria group bacterium]